MSNRAVREGVVKCGNNARELAVNSNDPLMVREVWFEEGIVRAAMIYAKRDTLWEEPKFRKTAPQWFKELKTWK